MSNTEADILLKAAERVQARGIWKKGMDAAGDCAVTAPLTHRNAQKRKL